jgi:hypothetical protein
MNTRQTLKRLANLEERFLPRSDGSFTLEELCRSAWLRDKKGFRKRAESIRPYRFYLRQFEYEDSRRN